MSDLPDLAPLYARHDASNKAWQERRDMTSDPTISWDLARAEKLHYLAQEPVEFTATDRAPLGTILMDKDGDGWEYGRTRWTQISGNDRKYLRVPGVMPPREHGPYREVGKRGRAGAPTSWRYRLVRPRKVPS